MTNIEGIYKQAEFMAFVVWMATPPSQREPVDQNGLAEELDVEPATLSDWKKHKDFWPLVESESKNLYGRERTLKLLDAWYAKILLNPKAADIELWLSYYNDFAKKQDLNVNTDALEAKSKLEELLANNYKKTNDNQSGTEQGDNQNAIQG